jgi:hypothetical protein
MTVLVAYSADQYGAAALDYGITEATRSAEPLVVVNVTKGDALVDARYAGAHDAEALRGRLATLDVPAELRQAMSPDVTECSSAPVSVSSARARSGSSPGSASSGAVSPR